MNVVRYEPVSMIRHFHDQVNRLMQDDFGTVRGGARVAEKTQDPQRGWAPAVDVKEEDGRYLITADVPGVEPKDIEITMDAGVLSIKGSRGAGSQQTGDAYSRIERVHGEFERRFTLPEGADADGIEASSSHGVLSVSIPKKPAPQVRRIEIQ